MKIATYTGTFENQPTRVTVHETQGIIFATLEVNARPVPPTLQSEAQRSLLAACKQHTKQQPNGQRALARSHELPTTSDQTASSSQSDQTSSRPADQPTAGALRITGAGEAAESPRAAPGTTGSTSLTAPTNANTSVLLAARTTRIRVPAQRPSRMLKELIDA